MTVTPSELAEMLQAMDDGRPRVSVHVQRPYICDCGAVYHHPDALLYCAQNRHWQGSPPASTEHAGEAIPDGETR